MFHHRSSDFGPSVTAIQQHLGAVEKNSERSAVSRDAGRQLLPPAPPTRSVTPFPPF